MDPYTFYLSCLNSNCKKKSENIKNWNDIYKNNKEENLEK